MAVVGSGRGIVLLVFLAIIGFFPFTEHRAHLFGVLPSRTSTLTKLEEVLPGEELRSDLFSLRRS
jgi:hypothetical protein